MADSKLIQQMLEHLVNDEQAKAEELFHEYVVQQSREIYESLIDSEIAEETDEDEEMEEASEETDEDAVEENFEDIAIEADDEMDLDSEDPTDDLAGDMGPEEGEAEEQSEEELFQDLESIVDELQAKFDQLKGMEQGEHEMDGDTGAEEMEGINDLETVREYVERVADGHGAEKKSTPSGKMAGAGSGEMGGQRGEQNTSSLKFQKNDMGGTTANILSGRDGADAGSAGAGSTIKGSALSNTKPQEMNTGNINVPGGKAGNAFSKKEPGHGAEKKGSATGKMAGAGTGEMGGQKGEQSTSSLFRGRR